MYRSFIPSLVIFIFIPFRLAMPAIRVVLDTQISARRNSLNVYTMSGRVPSRLSKAAVKAADVFTVTSPLETAARQLPRELDVPGFSNLSFHRSLKIVFPAPVIPDPPRLPIPAGDIRLRNFYVGSRRNGIQSRLAS